MYYHDLAAGADGMVSVAVVNRDTDAGTGFGAYVGYSRNELPYFVEWKMMGQGTYVVGWSHPTASWAGAIRSALRARTPIPRAGECREYRLEIGVSRRCSRIRAFEGQVQALLRSRHLGQRLPRKDELMEKKRTAGAMAELPWSPPSSGRCSGAAATP